MHTKLAAFTKKLFVFCIVSALVVIFYKCPIKLIFGVPCPGCGLTRAFLSALKLDFNAAFRYHPLFPLIGIEIVYYLLMDFFKVNKRFEFVISVITLVLLFVVWLLRK